MLCSYKHKRDIETDVIEIGVSTLTKGSCKRLSYLGINYLCKSLERALIV